MADVAPPAAPLLPAASFDVDESVAALVLQHVEDPLDRFALAGVSRWGPYKYKLVTDPQL